MAGASVAPHSNHAFPYSKRSPTERYLLAIPEHHLWLPDVRFVELVFGLRDLLPITRRDPVSKCYQQPQLHPLDQF